MSGSANVPAAKRHKGGESDTNDEEPANKVEESPTKADLKATQAALKARIAELHETIADMLEKSRKVAERRSLQALLTLEEGQFKLARTGNDSSHVDGVHKSATATEKTFTLLKNLDEGDKLPMDSVSTILMSLIDQHDFSGEPKFKSLEYTSKANVAFYVKHILHDAIAILKYRGMGNTIGDLTVFQERSLFSGRPDILVVRSPKYLLPLLIVEIKKPVVSGSLVKKGQALGQAFDYAESLRACGHPLPVVVLTSLQESCVCWNSDMKDRFYPRYSNNLINTAGQENKLDYNFRIATSAKDS
jgi:hypothetical protein